MSVNVLDSTAMAMVEPKKGILAADESTGTIKKRLDNVGVESTEENRRTYRELLFTTKNMENYISGVIMFDETLRQTTRTGESFLRILTDRNVIPGIKVDKSVFPLAGASDYPITEGLDGLQGRCDEYANMGARFTKWRAVIKIVNHQTPDCVIKANTHALARYAAIAQASGLVPIVEPEVLMDGNHSIETCQKTTERTLISLYDELYSYSVRLEGTVLKPNMILPGSSAPVKADTKEIADRTIEVLQRCVPSAVPGVAFLSGGQSEKEATLNLNAINTKKPYPWELTFSYGRALQQSALQYWSGKQKNIDVGQKIFLHRARMNSLAHSGEYNCSIEEEFRPGDST